MAKRGPKPRPDGPTGSIDWTGFAPPPDASDGAKAEFFRVVEVLREKGTLERTDPSVVLNLARITDFLDRACAGLDFDELVITSGNGSLCPNPLISIVNAMTVRRRGLMNDLGLTPASSRYSSKVNSGKDKPEDPVRRFLKISG